MLYMKILIVKNHLGDITFNPSANRMAISGIMDGANRSSNAARVLIIASVVVGIIIIIVTTVLRSGVIY